MRELSLHVLGPARASVPQALEVGLPEICRERESPPRPFLEQLGPVRQRLAVDGQRLATNQAGAGVDRVLPAREVNGRKRRAELAEHLDERPDAGRHPGVGGLDQRLDDPDAQTVQPVERRCGITGLARRCGSCEDGEQRVHVRHRARQWADGVERGGHRLHAPVGHGAVGRPDPRHPAQRRGQPDGAAGIRSDRGQAEVGGDRGSRAAARATGNPVGRGGVDDRAEGVVRRRRAERELVHVRLAEDHRACLPEAERHLGVVCRRPVGEEP